jgi:5-methylcytosine-specific restriction enzyme A
MPDKTKKYCAAFPCKNLALPGSAYCKVHQPKTAHKVADAFYVSPEWRRFRNWYISNHPLCEQCLADGYTVRAVIVDHIHELKDGGARFDENNARSLCRACHNKKTKVEAKKRGGNVYHY